MRPLTPPQARVIDFIRRFVADHGYPPTHAEIAAALRWRSANAAAQHVRLLAKKGALAIEPGVARGLKLLAPAAPAPLAAPRSIFSLPVIGEVAAGQPILAQENHEQSLAIDPALFAPRADFLLRVRGDSMVEAGIEPGDLVAVHRTPIASDGQIAVVRLDDEVTVKRFRMRGRGRARTIVLEPANARLRPIVVDPATTQVAIEGLVVGLLRIGARP